MLTQKCNYFFMTLVMLMLLVGGAVAADKDKPSGTVVIDETQVMLLLGGDVGGGVLLFGDKSYAFKTGGLKLGGVGVHKVHLTGDVYHLKNVDDFAGVYFAAEAGITVAKGIGGYWMQNDMGVTLHLKGNADGLAFGLGAEGFKVTLD